MPATAVLGPEIALAAAAAPTPPIVRALVGNDPLRLDLPALPGAGVAPQTLRALSALYLAARLEETGLVHVAEALVRQRATLRVGVPTAARLEDFARRQPQFLAAEQRAALFARLFGTGAAAGSDAAATAARFEPLLAALCSALVACGPLPAGPVAGRRLAVELAGRDVAHLAGLVASGGAVLAVERLNEQLRRSIDVLSDAGIGALVQARGPWETLRALLGSAAPDLRRLIDCGRHGQRVLLWLSGTFAAPSPGSGMAGPIAADVVTSAAAWLTACGLPPRASGEGSI